MRTDSHQRPDGSDPDPLICKDICFLLVTGAVSSGHMQSIGKYPTNHLLKIQFIRKTVYFIQQNPEHSDRNGIRTNTFLR